MRKGREEENKRPVSEHGFNHAVSGGKEKRSEEGVARRGLNLSILGGVGKENLPAAAGGERERKPLIRERGGEGGGSPSGQCTSISE